MVILWPPPSLSACDLVTLKYKKKRLITSVGPKKETDYQTKNEMQMSFR